MEYVFREANKKDRDLIVTYTEGSTFGVTHSTREIDEAVQNGYVQTPFGRKCFIRGITDPKTKGLASRAAINAPIQGGAADIIKMAMQKVVQKIKETNLDATLLLQVHDELVFEVKEDQIDAIKVLLKETMENAVSLSTPLIVEIGIADNWKDAH
jgi:DNA polymerase-1